MSLNVSGNRLSDIDEFGLVGDASSNGDAAPSPFHSSGNKDSDNYCTLNIQNLDLSCNSLRRLGRAGFSRLRRLAKLRLDNNLLNELTDTSFSGLSQLKLLNLSSNRLVALPPSIFTSSIALRELYLQNNSISALAPHVFTGLDQLLVLDVSRNSLTSQWVRDSIFSGLIRLIVLKLSYNQLTSIDSVFSELSSLQALYLDNNEISSISPSAFTQLRNLHILNLSNNRLQFVDGRLLSNLFVLRQLYLDHNQIREMDANSLKNCSSLEDLGLSNNHLQEVPVALRAGLANLKTLDIGENRITFVSNEAFDLPQVYGLRMVENRITELPAGFCSSMKNLRVLNIAQNNINKIHPEAFTNCTQVRALRLDGNSLVDLPTSQLTPLGQLLWLNVSDNNLRTAHLQYRLMGKIEWLDLSHNEIESLKQSDKQNSSIRVLDVSYNNLEMLDKDHIPPSLETLRVNHNKKLTKINPDTFVHATQLRRVELTGNQIENLPLSALKVSGGGVGSSRGLDKPLPEFYIGGNPFVCDCSMEWLTRVNQLAVLRQYPNIVDLQAISCRPTSPRSTSNTAVVPLLEAQSKDFFLCPYTSHCFATCHCCEFDACDCEMTCPSVNETHSCQCVHNTAWSANIVDCSNLKFSEIPPIPIDSTEVYLDGNVIPALKRFAFLGRKNLQSLYLNSSAVQGIENNTFSSLKLLTVLHLEDNLLPELKGYEFKHLQNLKELYLQNNRISYIHKDTFSTPTFSLQVLRLDGNRLVDFHIWDLKLSASRVMLANPFTCDCNFIANLRKWAASLSNTILVDYSFAKCLSEEQLEHLKQDGSNNSSAILISSGQPISSVCSQSFNYNRDNPALLPSASSAPNGGSNHVGLMNNHISSGGGAGLSTSNIGSSSSDRYHHAHLEKQGGNYHEGFPQNENIAGTAAAGGGGLRRSSKTSHDDYNESHENSTFFTVLVTFIAIIVLAAIAFLVALVAFRKRRVSQDSTSWLWWWCCDINGSSSKCLSVSAPNEARLGLGSNSDTDFSDKEKLFDAYFLYSQSDEEFVTEKLIGELERGPVVMHPQHQHYYQGGTLPGHKKLRVCLHFRDLCLAPDNPWSSEMILSAMSSSRTVVLVVSNNFLNTEWSNNHFRTAVVAAAHQHCKKLVVIRLPPVNDQIFTFPVPPTKLDWGEANFWPKLRQLIPPSSTLLPAGDHTTNDISSQLAYTTNFNHTGMNNFLNSAANNNAAGLSYQMPIIPSHHYHQPSDPVSTIAPPLHQQHPHFLTMMNWTGQGIPMNHSSSIHPVPSQLTPQQFGYSNIDGFQNCSQQTLFSPHHQQQQPLHFSSSNNNSRQSHRQQHSARAPHHNSHCHPANHHNNPPGHGQHHIHSLSQLSNMSSSKSPVEGNYSSSAISSANEEFDHVYSTLDSPLESPCSDLGPGHVSGRFEGAMISGAQVNRHQIQHSTSSGISSASDATSGTGGCHPGGGGSGPPMYFV